MHSVRFLAALLLLACSSSHLIISTAAYLTHGSIRNLTVLTDELRGEIGGDDDSLGVGGQMVLGSSSSSGGGGVGSNEGGEESEIKVAAAIRLLCADVLVELEKPKPKDGGDGKKMDCNEVIDEYHSFLAATVKFLRDISEEQMKWQWTGESLVFDAVAWLQSLWASRSANKQNRSFIEQQMVLYEYHRAEGCFGKDDEVLHRDVEVVEFLNDLLDRF